MNENNVILGLVDNRSAIKWPQLAAKCRDLTLTWSRYFYHGQVIEHSSVDTLLSIAASTRASYCLLLSYGQILLEKWCPELRESTGFRLASDDQTSRAFFVSGRILQDEGDWYGMDYRCLLVNLKLYDEFNRPSFYALPGGHIELPTAVSYGTGNKVDKLDPRPGVTLASPKQPGWRLIAESLNRGLPVTSIEQILGEQVLDLGADDQRRAGLLAKYLNGGLEQYESPDSKSELDTDQIKFLSGVSEQTKNAKCGVFLLNIEPYTDVDHPPEDYRGPVSTLYSVSAGFKPNRILQTHGMDTQTRVVFFDYSSNALEVRKTIVREWDGDDFPHFVKHIFRRFPHPATYYQLWNDCSPDNLDWNDVDKLWQQEIDRFGGSKQFKDHWAQYRTLKHDYIQCDIFGIPSPLLDRIMRERKAVMWFSNAPFTVYSNWRYTLDERKKLYESFISQVAERNPDLLLYGADYTNTSVNGFSASDYWQRYRNFEPNELSPAPLNKHQIRS